MLMYLSWHKDISYILFKICLYFGYLVINIILILAYKNNSSRIARHTFSITKCMTNLLILYII